MKKNRLKKFIASFLMTIMLCNSVMLQVFAADTAETGSGKNQTALTEAQSTEEEFESEAEEKTVTDTESKEETVAEQPSSEETETEEIIKPSEDMAETTECSEETSEEPYSPAKPEETEQSSENQMAEESLSSEEQAGTGSQSIANYAAGSTFNTATALSMGKMVSGTISSTNGVDFYKFTLSSSGRISLTGTYQLERVYTHLYDASGSQLWTNHLYWNNTTQQALQTETFYLASGTYYFCVERDWKYYGNYNFKMSFQSSGESFKEVQGGSNNTLNTASLINLNTAYKGQIALNDKADFYRFKLSSSGCVTLANTYNMRWVYTKIYTKEGAEVWSANPSWNSTSEQIVQNQKIYLTSGEYFFYVGQDSGYGKYNFKLSFTSSGESFKEPAGGNNNSLETADVISLNKTYKGQLALNDTVDFYKISIPKGGNYILSLNSSTIIGHIYVSTYDRNGKELWSRRFYESNGVLTGSQKLVFSAGTYYLAFQQGYTGNYAFSLGTAGWNRVGSDWVYTYEDGTRAVGWKNINGKRYYFNSNGIMQTGWLRSAGRWYYLDGSGAMCANSWAKINGRYYHFNSSGAMQTGWLKLGSRWYHMNSEGAMQTGWLKIGGKWYHMNSEGAMQTGWLKIGGKWYYMNGDGVMQTGWLKSGGKWYYLSSSGAMVTSNTRINGKVYRFNSNGVWLG